MRPGKNKKFRLRNLIDLSYEIKPVVSCLRAARRTQSSRESLRQAHNAHYYHRNGTIQSVRSSTLGCECTPWSSSLSEIRDSGPDHSIQDALFQSSRFMLQNLPINIKISPSRPVPVELPNQRPYRAKGPPTVMDPMGPGMGHGSWGPKFPRTNGQVTPMPQALPSCIKFLPCEWCNPLTGLNLSSNGT